MDDGREDRFSCNKHTRTVTNLNCGVKSSTGFEIPSVTYRPTRDLSSPIRLIGLARTRPSLRVKMGIVNNNQENRESLGGPLTHSRFVIRDS